MSKKKFKETKVGQFLSKSGSKLLDVVGDVAPRLEFITNLIAGDPDLTPEQKQEAQKLLLEEYRLEVEDRKSARIRETNLAKAGKTDYMMIATGSTGLLSYIGMVLAVMFMPDLQDNKLFIHLMGIIEGVVISSLFAYYFGSSKGSKDKQSLLDQIIR